jgi:hypothetical protein
MYYNNLVIGSPNSQYLRESYINKLNVVDYSYDQNTVNNTVEKYYD